jgi:hypothetical protein
MFSFISIATFRVCHDNLAEGPRQSLSLSPFYTRFLDKSALAPPSSCIGRRFPKLVSSLPDSAANYSSVSS